MRKLVGFAVAAWIMASRVGRASGQDLPPVPPLPINHVDTDTIAEPAEPLPLDGYEARHRPRSLRDIPFDATPPSVLTYSVSNPRHAGLIVVPFERRGTYHQPLYFEDPLLERSGWSRWPKLQPGVSSVRFGSDALLFPWRVLRDRCSSPQPMYQ